MKKDRLAETTIKVTDRRLRMMAKAVDIDIPEKVREYLTKKEGKKATLRVLLILMTDMQDIAEFSGVSL